MNQNSTIDNDLQKAIDDITNSTNTDPVFSDPVAAPSSVPEGDTGELGEAVGPFPAPEPAIPVAETMATETQFIETPLPEPIMPQETITATDFDMQTSVVPPAPTPMMEPAPVVPTVAPVPAPEMNYAPTHPLGMQQVKEAALRDLVPLLDHLNINPSQKFNLYRDIFEDLRDYTVLEPAYHAATEITDEHERAEALLYLVESIDKM